MWMPMPHTQKSIVDLSIEIPQFETLQLAGRFLFQPVEWFCVVLYHTMDPNTKRKQMVITITTMAL